MEKVPHAPQVPVCHALTSRPTTHVFDLFGLIEFLRHAVAPLAFAKSNTA